MPKKGAASLQKLNIIEQWMTTMGLNFGVMNGKSRPAVCTLARHICGTTAHIDRKNVLQTGEKAMVSSFTTS